MDQSVLTRSAIETLLKSDVAASWSWERAGTVTVRVPSVVPFGVRAVNVTVTGNGFGLNQPMFVRNPLPALKSSSVALDSGPRKPEDAAEPIVALGTTSEKVPLPLDRRSFRTRWEMMIG